MRALRQIGILSASFSPCARSRRPRPASGSCSHAACTSKALERGETEGAMSGPAIGVCGLTTPLLSLLLTLQRRGRAFFL